MPEREKVQYVPVKVFRSEERLTVAAPMPGLQPEDIVAKVLPDGQLVIEGSLRGILKDIKELLVDEWSVGGYHRELTLPDTVDAEHANMTYGNGVLVIAFPLSEQVKPATLLLEKSGADHGIRAGNAGHKRD